MCNVFQVALNFICLLQTDLHVDEGENANMGLSQLYMHAASSAAQHSP